MGISSFRFLKISSLLCFVSCLHLCASHRNALGQTSLHCCRRWVKRENFAFGRQRRQVLCDLILNFNSSVNMFTEKKSILERKHGWIFHCERAWTCANMSQHKQQRYWRFHLEMEIISWTRKAHNECLGCIYSRWTRLHKEKFIFGSFIFHIYISRENFHCHVQFNERCQGFIMWSLLV